MGATEPREQMRAAKIALEQRVLHLTEQLSAAQLTVEQLKNDLQREQETLDAISRYLSSDSPTPSPATSLKKGDTPSTKRVHANGRTLPRHPILDHVYPFLRRFSDGAHHTKILDYLMGYNIQLNGQNASSTLQSYLNRAVGWGSLQRTGRPGEFALNPKATFEFE